MTVSVGFTSVLGDVNRMGAAVVGGGTPIPGIGGFAVHEFPIAGGAFKVVEEGMVIIHDYGRLAEHCQWRKKCHQRDEK